MAEQNIGQILQAFMSLESKLQEQNGLIRELTSRVKVLENQNKQLVQLVQRQQQPAASGESSQQNKEFQNTVTQRLRSLEDHSKKTMELIKSNNKAKTRAWP